MTQQVISFHYTLTNDAGEKIDSSGGGEPFSFVEGLGQIIPGLENQLKDLKAGDKKIIKVPAVDAYGERDASYVIKIAKDQLPAKDVKPGDRFRGGQDDHSPMFVVTAVNDAEVTLDGNHPLAGQDLTFDVTMVARRDATGQELEHGHAHGEHGHSH